MSSASDTADRPATARSATRVWLRRFAWFTVAWAVFLILAGANVTSTRTGDTVPDWPMSYGAWIWPDGWVQNRRLAYEHGHRLVATVMGLLSIVAAIWVHATDSRRGVRRLAWVLVGGVVVQGVLGGVRVLAVSKWGWDPSWFQVAHAVAAEVYFCGLVLLACALAPWWREGGERLEAGTGPTLDDGALRVLRGGVFALLVLLVQLFLGAMARHGILPREVHAVFALPTAVFLLRLVLHSAGDLPREQGLLRRPGMLLGVLLLVQLGLGLWSYLETSEVRDPRVPLFFGDVAAMTLHKVVGAALVGTATVLLARAVRVFGLPTDERVRQAREAAGASAPEAVA